MKILIVSHDAGGAEILSSWVRKNSDQEFTFLLEGPALNIFKRKLGDISVAKRENIKELLGKADHVLTGSGHGSDLERVGIFAAKERGVPVSAFLDHWTNYRERFLQQGREVLPDEIWVGDEYALAVAEKIFLKLKVKLVPNPYWADIQDELRQTTLPNRAADSGVHILYVTEPTSVATQKMYGDPRYYGYTEFEALEGYVEYLRSKNEAVETFRLRPHPSEPEDKYDDILKKAGSLFRIEKSKGQTLLEDCVWADWVVGCESMALVVGLLAGKKVFSALPENAKPLSLPQSEITRLFQGLPPVALKGNRIYLERFSEKYLTQEYVDWFNDVEVCRYNRHGETVYTLEKAQEFFKSIQNSKNNLVFAICALPSGKHIGNISLDISWSNLSGDIAIIVGDKNYWGKGVGTEAFQLVKDHAFNALKLHRLKAGMTTNNQGMIGIVKRLGFQEEGVFKDALKKGDRYFDIVQWAIINSEGSN